MFDDTFVEEIVARKTTGVTVLVRVGVIVLAVILCFALASVPVLAVIFPLLFAVICVAAYIVFRSQGIEYEYAFTNGDLDVDKIIGKRRRKRVFEVNSQQILVMAPYTAEYESEAVAHQVTRSLDFSSSPSAAGRYFMICEDREGQKQFVVFEPSERFRTAMKKYLKFKLKG